MKQTITRQLGNALLGLSTCLLLTSVVLADSGPAYELSWWTVDGGGATFSCTGVYCMGSTVGQPDAGLLTDGYALSGGFWSGVAVAHRVYLPVVLRQS